MERPTMKLANLKLFGIVLFFAVAAQADTLVLRSGKSLNGTLKKNRAQIFADPDR
jgi:hypothetical protein